MLHVEAWQKCHSLQKDTVPSTALPVLRYCANLQLHDSLAPYGNQLEIVPSHSSRVCFLRVSYMSLLGEQLPGHELMHSLFAELSFAVLAILVILFSLSLIFSMDLNQNPDADSRKHVNFNLSFNGV